MTENKKIIEDETPLTPEEEEELLREQEYFKNCFSKVSCPPLPESLSAENIWNKICAGEGDRQIFAEPNLEEPFLEQQEAAQEKKMGKRIDFPLNEEINQKQQNKVVSVGAKKHRWAIACTLVLAVGLSAVYWKMKEPMKTADMVVENAAPQEMDSDSKMSEKEEQKSESKLLMGKQKAVPKVASAPQQLEQQADLQKSEQQELPKQDEKAKQPEEQTVQQEKLQERMAEHPDAEKKAESEPREQLHQKILAALSQEKASEKESAKEENSEAVQFALEAQGISENMAEAIEDSEPPADEQEYSLKNGSLSYSAQNGKTVVYDKDQKQTASIQLPTDAQIITGDHYLFAVTSDEESQMVRVIEYNLTDLSNPVQGAQFSQQGELFDLYRSGASSCTVVTSVWFTKEQVEAGAFLPMVNGQEFSAENVQVIEGYSEQGKINYILTTTLTEGSVTTRGDLYLQ